ncbi:MAG: DNA-processing protein DprA [Saprospiraceae bacterium]
MDTDLLYKIAMTKIPLVGAITAKNLISYCGGVQAVFETKKKALLRIPGVGETVAKHILQQKSLGLAEQEMNLMEHRDMHALFYLDDHYPNRLKHFANSPVLLYYQGNADLNHARMVSIVGTRKPTSRGLAVCESLIAGLQEYDVVIVSGLAYGIDVAAHKESLALGIDTIGVLGHGLDRIYPAQHRKVAKEMTTQGGLLTEYGIGTQPDREHFPMRNRIIAGLCDALIVVETARKGGSMITVEIANSYQKDVFAVPGRLGDKYAVGCNHAIKCHKAALLESAEDIAYIMRWDRAAQAQAQQQKLFVELSAAEQSILNLMGTQEEITIDQLLFGAKMSASQLAGILLSLEFKAKLKVLPGKRFLLLR